MTIIPDLIIEDVRHHKVGNAINQNCISPVIEQVLLLHIIKSLTSLISPCSFKDAQYHFIRL
jgi:hypothetical protein